VIPVSSMNLPAPSAFDFEYVTRCHTGKGGNRGSYPSEEIEAFDGNLIPERAR